MMSVLLVLLAVPLAADVLEGVETLTPEEAAQLQGEVTYLDVRSSFEWWQGHVKGAVHIPHGDVKDEAEGKLDKATPIVTYCAVGGRASRVVKDLESLGYRVVPVTGGGFKELVEAGLERE
ncbi:MAG: rhodanese-like domain-containing protein [Pseudomonadota bacterium]